MRGKSFKVRRDTRAGGRVESRDRQNDRRRNNHMVGQFFAPSAPETRPYKTGPAAPDNRASRQVEMYACERPHAIEFFLGAVLETHILKNWGLPGPTHFSFYDLTSKRRAVVSQQRRFQQNRLQPVWF
jgi:hypothetical protein